MSGDSFNQPYLNPRTKKMTYGAAACSGRIKTLGGMDNIQRRIIEETVKLTSQRLLADANSDQTGTN